MRAGETMRSSKRGRWAAIFLAAFGLWTAASAAPAQAQRPGYDAAIRYVPPLRGAPGGRMSGASRGWAVAPFPSFPLPSSGLEPLAPKDVAFSAAPRPTLFWRGPSDDALLEFRLREVGDDARQVRLLVEAAGGAVSLERLGLSLSPFTPYRWSIAPIGSDEPAQEAALTYVPMGQEIAEADPVARARRMAELGYWYDALAALAEAGEEASGMRADLLKQGGF